MRYQKRAPFFRRIASKIGKGIKPKSDNSNINPTPTYKHRQNQDIKRTDDFPLLEKLEKGLSSQAQEEKKFLQSTKSEETLPHTTENPKTPTNSGLLAAKLQCDEWGVLSRKSVPVTFIRTVNTPPKVWDKESSVSTISPKTVELRISKFQHPSYKPPTVQRHRSMKERREAKEKARKFRGFQSSLVRIDEIDEYSLH